MSIFESCVWFEGGEKRNAIASMVAGVLVRILEKFVTHCCFFPFLYGN